MGVGTGPTRFYCWPQEIDPCQPTNHLHSKGFGVILTEIYLGWEYSAWYGRWMRPSAFGVVISVVDGACDSVQLAKHNVAVYSGSLDKLAVVK